ncbi:N-(5'-phosphoribosyl)anthranilate isomerase [Vallitalea longa]|uniref:N-(5'-phosphoribosyl)anthranilate isomerase n=1 Tax=Vallitalea longa TaxID=2936439 RepID=A0A9W5YBM9_9FIRM|nr:phosphoribosylanthranilate isomerase [Vallitalea longa]GKX29393.1 N-(5'-phosphoribosyl)anthranilate isomerase [Vallitalea longa]
MIPEIKICGIKNIDEINIINEYPVNYIGFIFAPSKRQVTQEMVMKLRDNVRKNIKAVGVFVDEEVSRINELASTCKLDIVQLHGNENNEYCKKIKYPIWKSIAVSNKESLEAIDSYKGIDGILLDTYYKGKKGGTGKIFNWHLVKNISKHNKVILAGGLKPENIIEAVDIVKPQIIDVNSGVETNIMKDENKIKELFNKWY